MRRLRYLWGGTVEAVVHTQQSNHQIKELFNLPRSISVVTAQSTLPSRTPWDGIFLSTIHGERDAQDAGVLFEKWQPVIAILALPSSLSRKERNLLSGFKDGSFKDHRYSRQDL